MKRLFHPYWRDRCLSEMLRVLKGDADALVVTVRCTAGGKLGTFNFVLDVRR